MADALEPDRVSLLLGTYVFEDLSPAQLEPLAREATIRHAAKGEYIFHQGDPADEIIVVASGQLKDAVETEDGDEVVHSVFGPGMVIGEVGFVSRERNRVMGLVALEPCMLLVIGRSSLTSFLHRYPQATLRMLEGLSSIARNQTEIIAALARRPLSVRLLLRLLDLAETNTQQMENESMTPKISQATLASMVGVSRENVNRALATLAAEGSIRIEDGRYVLIEPNRLRDEIAYGWPILSKPNRRT